MVSVNSYIVKAHACDEYAASPSFLYTQSWVNQHDQSQIGVIHERTTRTLTDHYSLQPTEIIMVGTVSKKRLQCSPIGSFQGQHTLQDSKYELILERSYNPYFAAEYDVAMEHLPFVQTVESPDLESKGLLTSDGLMLGAKVFILRDSPETSSPMHYIHFEQDIDDMLANLSLDRDIDFVDNVTNNWPVPEELSPRLEVIKHSHRACPLNVICGGYPVAPLDVENVIRNAMVEVTFVMKHFRGYIDHQDQSCFTGTIKQIVLLEPALV